MEAYLLDWVNLLLRWLHVITAIGINFGISSLTKRRCPHRQEAPHPA